MEELWQLKNQAQILWNFHPRTEFASEQNIRDMILKRFYFEECVYHNTWAMTEALQHRADLIEEEDNKLYKTTIFEYDPLSDEEHSEEFSESASGTGSAQSDVTTKANDFPMGEDINTPRSVSSTENGSNTYSNTQNKRDYTLKKKGLRGVRSTQQLIEEERKIILAILPKYVEEFSELFMITI